MAFVTFFEIEYNMDKKELSAKIKEYAYSLGFDACGICKAEAVDADNRAYFEDWIQNQYHADMEYMARNMEKRVDPTLLVEGAKSIIVMALNYYPHEFQDTECPQIAYYAYGKDYHDIVKAKLSDLYGYCQALDSAIEGRYFCDTAPLMERYWASKAGIGWVGKNSLLIIPKRGSYFFLATLVLNIDLEYDPAKKMPDCVNCTKCIDACPTEAIVVPRVIDSLKCLSYQTIENKGEIADSVIPNMSNRFYGCDICQQVCPWNKFASAHETEQFNPSAELLALTSSAIENLNTEDYQRIFKGSAMKRAKLDGLKRNIAAWKVSKDNI